MDIGKLRTIIGGFLALASICTAILLAVFKNSLSEYLVSIFTGPGSVSRIIAIALVLLNLKNIPLAWHSRMLAAVLKHIVFSTHRFSPIKKGSRGHPLGPAALFQPLISVSRSPMYECDWNLHKSNSTYFSDLDVSRHALISCLLREGVIKTMSMPSAVLTPDGVPAKGPRFMMLQSVQCSFRKEIPPYIPYEMWSRILCWDRKWLYVVTHFVKRHAVTPDGYTLNSMSVGFEKLFGSRSHGRSKAKKETYGKKELYSTGAGPEIPDDAIYASSISRYVAKSGRLTIHPEVLLSASGLLPPKPGGWSTMADQEAENKDVEQNTGERSDQDVSDNVWDWRWVEAENSRGMKLAANLDRLEGSHMEFTGSKRGALGMA